VEIETPQGAASGAATGATILASAHLGFGLSTTHVATGAIVGSGVGRKGALIRWAMARRMVFAWLLTLPGAALVGGAAALLADRGTAGVVVLLVLLAAVCVLIWSISRRNKVNHLNVNDSHEVLVLNAAQPASFVDGHELESDAEHQVSKAKGAA
jgi:PiT family inorganic phosphate transporter